MRQRSSSCFWKPGFYAPVCMLIFMSFAGQVCAATSITFVGASTLSDYPSPVTSVAINLPSGVQAGDLLIAQIADYDGTGSNIPTAPSGWVLVRHDSGAYSNRITSWLYYKISGNNEPSSYSWGIGTEWAVGAMGAWRGAMSAPLDIATGTAAIGNSPISASPPTSTPTYSNELRICFYASQGGSAPALSLPGALTERLDVRSSKEGFTLGFGDANAATYENYGATEVGGGVLSAQSILIVAASGSGPTPTLAAAAPTATPTPPPTSTPVSTPTAPPTPAGQPTLVFGGATVGIAFVASSRLSDYGGPVSSVAVSLPAGVEAGDCLLAQIVVFDPNASDVPTAPSGWTLIRRDFVSGGYKLTSWVYYKIAGSAEPATYSWNIASQWAAGAMGAWRGTSSQPIDGSAGATGTGKGVAAPSVTPSYGGELEVDFYGSQGDSAPTITIPTTLTEVFNTSSSLEGFALAFGEAQAPSAGTASPTYKATETGGAATSAQAILLIPANHSAATPTPTATATPVATPTPGPTVKLVAPQAAATVAGTVQVVSQVTGAVSFINLYLDSNLLAQSAPLTYNWDTTKIANGSHILSVQGYNSSNIMLGTNAINISVLNQVNPTPTPTPTRTVAPTPTLTPTATPTMIADPLRPSNTIPNNRVPTAAELTTFHDGTGACGGLDTCSYMQNVTGQFTGTTAQIIQNVANKWCANCTILNPADGETYTFGNLLKAVAVNETHWYQWRTASLSTPDPITGLTTLTPSHGDLEHVTVSEPFGGSWGLYQIAEGVNQGWPASFPLSAVSTGFNADFKIAYQMGVEQGHLDYLGDPSRAEIAIANGYAPYTAYTDSNGVLHPASTDVNQRRWGAVGAWYSGGWYDSAAISYIQQVQQYLHSQPWNQSGF